MPDAPDSTPPDYAARLARINSDLDWARKAGPSATIYVTKYVEDMEFLMALAASSPTFPKAPAAPNGPKSDMEVALEHDAAGRSERRSTKPKT